MSDHLRSSEWFVDGLAMADGAQLVRDFHYSRSVANTCVASHGLYREDDFMTPLGAALWMPPTPNAAKSVAGEGWRGVLCLSRLVVLPGVPTNGASFLLGRSMKLLNRKRWPVLLTYADTRLGHTGAIYRATNWQELGPVPAGDRVDRTGRAAARTEARSPQPLGGRTRGRRVRASAGRPEDQVHARGLAAPPT